MKVIIKNMLWLFLLVFVASGLFVKRAAIACELVPWSHFKETKQNIFIDESINNASQITLINSFNSATERVTNIYGKPSVKPRIIATNNRIYSVIGLNPTGMHVQSLSSQCIFIGPKGNNTDVLAHELVHAEVYERSSLYTELFKLPAWFIEGTAIKVDYRAPFLLENIQLPQQTLDDVKATFHLVDFDNTSVESYQAARVVIESIDTKELYDGLEQLNNGKLFDKVFPL